MTMENDVAQMKVALYDIRHQVKENGETLKGIVGFLEVTNGTLQEILAACASDGSGDLAAALRQNAEAIETMNESIKELTQQVENLADEVQ
jgi:methyl-accepting chemotaxis protein